MLKPKLWIPETSLKNNKKQAPVQIHFMFNSIYLQFTIYLIITFMSVNIYLFITLFARYWIFLMHIINVQIQCSAVSENFSTSCTKVTVHSD